MKQLQLTLPTTAENLALDEVLLNASDRSVEPIELLRVWENPKNAIIIGRSSKVKEEVNEAACQRLEVEYLRRASGGASVAIGPGCLMYAVVLDYRLRPDLRMLDRAHDFVMQRLQKALRIAGIEVKYQGTCDLTLEDRKFSGNSLRCLRNCLLYHGTLLYDFPLDLMQDCLGTPPRQPDYREARSHRDFVCNLPSDRNRLTSALLEAWDVHDPLSFNHMDDVRELAERKYGNPEWNYKR